jgi:predicted TIM-barrel fold metal-dependent hydrolase
MSAVIDVDSHVFEPRDTWEKYVDPGLRHLALRITDRPVEVAGIQGRAPFLSLGDQDFFQIPLVTPKGLDDVDHAAQRVQSDPEEFERAELLRKIRETMFSLEEGSLQESWDGHARLRWMDEVGISQAVLFPTWGLMWEQFVDKDPLTVCANMQAYNRWILDFASADPKRLLPVGELTLLDPRWAQKEIAALARQGVRLCRIRPILFNGKSLAHRDHAGFWDALADHDMALCFHIDGSGSQGRDFFDEGWHEEEVRGPASGIVKGIMPHIPAMLTLTTLLRMGIFERYPRLRLGMMELGAAWVSPWIEMCDQVFKVAYTRDPGLAKRCPELPSFYLRRNMWFSTFESEDMALNLEKLGADRFFFASDYPHPEASPRPVDTIRRKLASLPEVAVRAILSGNGQSFLKLNG